MKILRDDGTECNAHESGRIAVKLPLPPGTMCTLYKADERFIETYFSKYEVGASNIQMWRPIENMFRNF